MVARSAESLAAMMAVLWVEPMADWWAQPTAVMMVDDLAEPTVEMSVA
jgi:hypothetical protein